MARVADIHDVEQFWSTHPCGSDQSSATERRAYFEEIARHRYELIKHIQRDARFGDFQDKSVLEVGCGVGTDGVQFARNGAIYTGINLDEGSTRLAQENFSVSGVPGAILKMDAEEMLFTPASFDHVYSYGVIHHSPNPERIVQEMYRVLKPGGTASLMVYNKSSINYYLEIMFLRKLFRLALIPSFAPGLISAALGLDGPKLRQHREIFLSKKKMSHDRWVSINTDGPDCPLARVYSRTEVVELFQSAGFKEINTFARFFNTEHYGKVAKLIPVIIAEGVGNIWGWCRWVEARKPMLDS